LQFGKGPVVYRQPPDLTDPLGEGNTLLCRILESTLLALLLWTLFLFNPFEGWAQQLPPRIDLPPAPPGPCELREESSPDDRESTDEERIQAANLLSEANQAAILGDRERARSLLLRAADLYPSSGDIAYRLGRILEEAGEVDAALAAYCRYLSLAPDGPDVLDVEWRVSVLDGSRDPVIPEPARTAFALGIEAIDRGDHSGAALHFSRALVERPDWPEAHYNRGIAHLEDGREAAGRADLERYLELRPDAPHADIVATRVGTASPASVHSPRTALVTGLIFPGMGHFYSGRPRSGAIVLVGAAAAAAGSLYNRVNVTCRTPPIQGECPPGEVAERIEERPYLIPGLAVAGLFTVVGAIHASRAVAARSSGLAMAKEPALRLGLDTPSGDRWNVTFEVEPQGRWGTEGVVAGMRIRF